jgi:hypothetical protein
MAFRIIKQTETLAIVKVWGTNSTDTIVLATDLLSSTMIVSGTPTVNITYVQWYVSAGASDNVTVTRNAIPVFNLYQNGDLDFAGNGGFADDTGNTSSIVVTITGTGGCYLTLRKAAGYLSKVQPERYGSYDNTASTTA